MQSNSYDSEKDFVLQAMKALVTYNCAACVFGKLRCCHVHLLRESQRRVEWKFDSCAETRDRVLRRLLPARVNVWRCASIWSDSAQCPNCLDHVFLVLSVFK